MPHARCPRASGRPGAVLARDRTSRAAGGRGLRRGAAAGRGAEHRQWIWTRNRNKRGRRDESVETPGSVLGEERGASERVRRGSAAVFEQDARVRRGREREGGGRGFSRCGARRANDRDGHRPWAASRGSSPKGRGGADRGESAGRARRVRAADHDPRLGSRSGLRGPRRFDGLKTTTTTATRIFRQSARRKTCLSPRMRPEACPPLDPTPPTATCPWFSFPSLHPTRSPSYPPPTRRPRT